MGFYLVSITSDALFKILFCIVLITCIVRYFIVMKYKKMKIKLSVDVRPKMIIPVLIVVIV